ncbi:MAG TPA: tryptophan--tRNA ligase [Acidimicrobiia bacterium]|nr:tryptophan--tRNA ligase [Acidimicrobiia bacterium]
MGPRRVFSGIQPTGDFHVGSYVGALRNWVALQDQFDETIYCVVDLHAMTVPYDPADLRARRHESARMLLAVGVDPDRSLLYYQSEVPQHVELAWILGTLAGLGQLERMTQFKEKADRAKQNLGIFAYPVLQAADILVHKAHAVPVGDDQSQHLELTRDLAHRFNSRFGEEFPLPETITPEIGSRIMSLTDPTAKMSKSDPSPRSRILLKDGPDEISKKVKAAVTDTGSDVVYDWEAKPGVSNLLELFSVFTGRPIPELVDEYSVGGYGVFKGAVADAIVEGLAPVREAYDALDDAEVTEVMARGAGTARDRAETSMKTVRERVGIV